MTEVLKETAAWAIVIGAGIGFLFSLWQAMHATHDCIEEWDNDFYDD